MDHEIDKQDPSSKEGGEMKVGDKVWVLCEVAMVYKDRAAIYFDVRHDNAVFEAKRSNCRPVEPPVVPDLSAMGVEVVSCIGSSVKRPVEPVVKESFTTESNSPEIPDSSSEQIQVGDAVRFVSPGHDRHGTEGIILSIVRGPNRQYRFDSNCGQFHRYCTASELELTTKRYRTPTLADLVNGPIDCEVRDYHDEPWTPRRLVCVHRTRARRFLTEIAVLWNQCRIEAGE